MSDTSWRPVLHEQLERAAARHRRLSRGAAAAASAAALGWLAGLEPGWHAAALLAAAAAAVAWPLRARPHEVWRTIGDQAGLAYQTHVEHRDQPDPHGLLAAAAVQARLSVRAVVAPRRGDWWLPLLALTLALWLLGALLGGPNSWLAREPAPQHTPAVNGPQPGAAPAPATVRAEDEADGDGPPAPEADTADDPNEAGRSDPGPSESAPAGAGAGGEREALERFLDGLRERPTLRDDPAQRAAERDGVRDDADAELRQAEVRDEPGGDDGAALTPSNARDEADTLRQEEVDLPGGGAGDGTQDDASDESSAEGDGAGEEQAGAEQDPSGGEAGGLDGQPEAGDDTASGADETGPSQAALGGDEPGFDEGLGDEAGGGVGAPAGGFTDVPDPAGDLEALPSILGPGPEAVGGQVRLPGRDSDLSLDGPAARQFERAVEQAVTDGAVPVTYQEIIRNYFR